MVKPIIRLEIYVGTQYDADGRRLDPDEVASALGTFRTSLALLTGGYTEHDALGASVECPFGEASKVFITFIKEPEVCYEAITALKQALRQGSILVAQSYCAIKFI
jgi:hypothetical protein